METSELQNKNILIITPFFAPETHAAVFRAHKLVKFLKRQGWNPIVLTVDTNYLYNEDATLLADLKDIKIVRTHYIEPTLRGIKMWLTGKDLTYKKLKEKASYNIRPKKENTTTNKTGHKNKVSAKLYACVFDHFLNSPDRFWTWKKTALKEARKLIVQYDVKYLYTTSSPYTTLEIGTALKSSFPNLRWITDFRDPLTYSLRSHSNIFSVYKKQKKIERKALNQADAITGTSSAYKLIYHDLYNGKFDQKMFFIPTGLDDDFLPKVNDRIETHEIIYIGEYLTNYGAKFFDYYRSFQENYPEFKAKLKVVIIGPIDINLLALQELNIENSILNDIQFEDQMSQTTLYKRLNNAKAVILSPGHESHWWTNFAKMVDYIALKKWVLAIVPDPSEARKQLSQAGIGLFLDSEENAIDILKKLANNETFEQNIDDSFCRTYLASSQVKSFINTFKSL